MQSNTRTYKPKINKTQTFYCIKHSKIDTICKKKC